MKKITFLLTLVLTLLSGKAWAVDVTNQVDLTTNVTAITSGHHYALQNQYNTGFYLRYNTSTNYLATNTSTGINSTGDGYSTYYWLIEEHETNKGTYSLKNLHSESYLGATTKSVDGYNWIEMSDEPVYFSITVSDGVFVLQNGENLVWTEGGYKAYLDAGKTSADNAAKWKLYDAEIFEYGISSWELKDKDGAQVAKSASDFVSTTVYAGNANDAAMSALGLSHLDAKYFSASVNEGVAVIQKTANIPFIISSGDADAWTWQTMTIRGKECVYKSNDAGTIQGSRHLATENLWAVTRGAKVGEYQLYNLAAGTSTPIGVSSTGTGSLANFSEANTIQSFALRYFDEEGFQLTADNYPLHDYGGTATLKMWQTTSNYGDGGNKFVLSEIDELIAGATLVVKEGCVGSAAGTADQIKAYEDAKTAYNAVGGATTTNLKLLAVTYAAISKVGIDLNKYYRIYSTTDLTHRFLSTEIAFAQADGTYSNNSKGRDVVRGNEADGANTVWSFVENGSGFRIFNANTGLALGTKANNNDHFVEMPVDAYWSGTYIVSEGSDNVSMIVAYDNGASLLQAHNNDDLTSFHDGQSGYQISVGTTYAHEWYIEEAKSVTVNVGSDIGYASVCFPFAVKIPAGAKAVVASAYGNDEITLADAWMEGEIMPANSPVLIEYAAGGDLVFEIQLKSEAGKPYSGTNLFKGTTARREGFTVKSLYALTANESNEAAMWCVDLTAFPANKAYILSTDLQDATGAVLKFNAGSLTGVDAIGNGKLTIDNAPVYDLSGRVVAKPTKGGVYIKGGKKYIVK